MAVHRYTDRLLHVSEMAHRLAVPTSWLVNNAAALGIPFERHGVGLYFREAAVRHWYDAKAPAPPTGDSV